MGNGLAEGGVAKRMTIGMGVGVVIILLLGCGHPPRVQPASQPTVMMQTRTARDAPVPDQVDEADGASPTPSTTDADPTLEASQYVLYGVPKPERVWSSGDYELAAQALQKVYDEDPALLPRLDSAKSGAVFERIVAEENLTVLDDETIPMATRASVAMGMNRGLLVIMGFYVSTTPRGERATRETLLIGSQGMRVMVATRMLADQAVLSVDQNDPRRERQLAALEQLQRAQAGMVYGTLEILSARESFSDEEYRWALSVYREPLTNMIRQLDNQARGEMLLRLMNLRGDERDPESAALLESIARDASNVSN